MTDNLLHITHNKNRSSFTLIELLVVLALVAILSVVVVMAINPAELLKQARDSNRLSDLATINTALNLFSTDATSGFMGTSTVVYISIPDNASSTCGSLGLPTLPSGYVYNCVTSQNLRNTDGTGWIPVNFNRISSNSPISQLPIDPQNTTLTKYYTYVTGGSWQLAVKMESQKYQAAAYTSGGADPSTYTIGNNLSLAPFIGGLVGWWKFDEGNGTSTIDSSGYRNNGSWSGSLGSQWAAGKVGLYSGNFNGTNNYVDAGDPSNGILDFGLGNFAMSAWIKLSSGTSNIQTVSGKKYSGTTYVGYCMFVNTYNTGDHTMRAAIADGVTGGELASASSTFSDNTWTLLTISRKDGSISVYKNGMELGKKTMTENVSSNVTFRIGAHSANSYFYFTGAIDDVRVYNRDLSDAEISALYNATK